MSDFFEKQGLVVSKLILDGAFGSISLAYDSYNQQDLALIKLFKNDFLESDFEKIKLIDENTKMELFKYYKDNDFVYLLIDYAPTDFYNITKKSLDLNPDQLLKFSFEILTSLKWYHDKNISHIDLKPTNFLFDKNGRIKLCDINISSISEPDPPNVNYKDTLMLMAPETLLCDEYDPLKADVWALGITFFFLASRIYPFYVCDFNTYLEQIKNRVIPINAIQNELFRDVIVRCLDYDPNNRPSVDEILMMPYFASYVETRKLIRERSIASRSHSVLVTSPVLQQLAQLGSSRLSRPSLKRRLIKHLSYQPHA